MDDSKMTAVEYLSTHPCHNAVYRGCPNRNPEPDRACGPCDDWERRRPGGRREHAKKLERSEMRQIDWKREKEKRREKRREEERERERKKEWEREKERTKERERHRKRERQRDKEAEKEKERRYKRSRGRSWWSWW